jgi:hypothetical protein
MARFKPHQGREYVVVGCIDTDPGCSGGAAGHLGLRRNARMAGPRIVPASDHPRHRRSLLYMKRHALLLLCLFLASPWMEYSAGFQKLPATTLTQACRPVFKRSRISVSNFSSPDGPGAGAGGFLNRFTCLMTTKRQKAIIRNSMTVLMNMP